MTSFRSCFNYETENPSDAFHRPGNTRDTGEEPFDVIRYFGIRGEIFIVHFRNIRGGFLNLKK